MTSVGLCGSALDPLCIRCGCQLGVLGRLLTVGALYFWIFCLLLRIFSPYLFLPLLPCPALIMRAFALCYCILFYPIWLSSLGDLICFEEEMQGEGRWGAEARRNGERGNLLRMYCMREESVFKFKKVHPPTPPKKIEKRREEKRMLSFFLILRKRKAFYLDHGIFFSSR